MDSVCGGGVVKHAASDGERVVLPDAPCQRWKVEVCLTLASDAGDVKADIVFVDDCDVRFAYSITSYHDEPVNSVEAPEGECDVHPQLVAPLFREAKNDVK